MGFSDLIQTLEKVNIQHRFGYIRNFEIIDDPNIIQSVLTKNTNTTRDLIEDLSSKYKHINYSHFNYFSVLSFGRQNLKYYYESLNEVVRFIVDTCLNEETKINGNLIVNIIEEISNKTIDIYNNLNNQQMSHQIIDIFNQFINDEMRQLIIDQEMKIQNDTGWSEIY